MVQNVEILGEIKYILNKKSNFAQNWTKSKIKYVLLILSRNNMVLKLLRHYHVNKI